jgi:hypothetical protein
MIEYDRFHRHVISVFGFGNVRSVKDGLGGTFNLNGVAD